MREEQSNPQPTEQLDFEKFYREYQRPLERFIASRVNEFEMVPDLAAEIMCSMLDYCTRSEEPIRQPRALLYKIARNRIFTYYKERDGMRREISIEEAPQIAGPRSLFTDIAARQELAVAQEALKD
ncbi:MAG: hypothetical protein AAB288_02205, partial [Acidobacteriota bacterium]